MAFETACYVTRWGIAARAVTTPEANVRAALTIQAGIDSIPVGTRFCVVVASIGPNSWQVDPSPRPTQIAHRSFHRQAVATTVVDSRVVIAEITPR
ncbi:hypothetical protein ACWIGW_41095 [Nocardia brasiliensis]